MEIPAKQRKSFLVKWTIFFALILPFVTSVLYFIILSDSVIGKVIYGSIKFFTLIFPLVFYKFVLRKDLGKLISEVFSGDYIKRALSALPAGVGLGFFIAGGILLFYYFSPLGEIVFNSGEKIYQKADSLGFMQNYFLFAILISVFHSLLEEYFWRWFGYGSIANFFNDKGLLNFFMPHLLAGFAFSLHHITVTTQFFPIGFGLFTGVMVGIGGMLWSLLYQKQNIITGAWISHIIVDLALMWIGWCAIYNHI